MRFTTDASAHRSDAEPSELQAEAVAALTPAPRGAVVGHVGALVRAVTVVLRLGGLCRRR